MGTCAVFFITRSGHARDLANEIGRKVGAEVFEIKDPVNRKGFIGYMNTGRQSMKKDSTPIVDSGINISPFDHIVIVEPTWAGSVPPPIRTWINTHAAELSGKKISLLVTNKGSPGEPIRRKFEEEFGPKCGKLSAFAAVDEKLDAERKAGILSDFVDQIK
jgi:hypothetical protein